MKKNTTNENLLNTTYIFIILFGILMIYLLFFVVFESNDIIDNSYNKRIDKLSMFVDRGNIYSNDMDILATNDEEGNRVYPYGSLFSHSVGSMTMGNTGLENAYNYKLLTSNASSLKKFINELSGEKHPGNSIVTSFDLEITEACKEAIGNYKGSIIVMDPKTGDVIAMVSNPDFDPNNLKEQWEKLSNSEDGELLNRATCGLYTPGSIFKIFTLYDYILENKDTYEKYNFTCKGTESFGDYSISCSNKTWHGTEDLIMSFANSCNLSFVNLGAQITNKSLENVCKNLLFNSDLPIDLEYKQSQYSLTNKDTDFLKSQTLIGQGKTLVTPMHMILVMNAIANDGILMKPRFVTSVIDYNGKTIEEYKETEYKTLFTKDESSLFKEYLRRVVTVGTASSINSFEYTLYGKTGTAQIDEKGNVNSWFLGFVEKNEKTYSICVVIENVNENNSPAKNITKNVILKLQ